MFGFLDQPRLKPYRPWLLLGLAILFVVFVRVRLRDMPLERDEGEYAYAGQLMLEGVPPYKEVYNMKLPGTYAAYACIMALFGQTPAGIHLGVMLVNVGSILFVFLLGRRLLDDTAGLVAAVCFALLSLSQSVLGLAGHATHFVTFFFLAAIYVLIRNSQTVTYRSEAKRLRMVFDGDRSITTSQWALACGPWSLFCGGLLLGFAFLMKQHGIFFCLFGVWFVGWSQYSLWRAARAEQITMNRGRLPGRPSNSVLAAVRPGTDPISERAPQTAAVPARRLNAIAMKRQGALQTESMLPAQGTLSGLSGKASAPETPVDSRSGLQSEAMGSSLNEVLEPQNAPAANREQGPEEIVSLPSPMKSLSRKKILIQVGILCAGILLPYLLTCVILAASGAFPQFVFWTITYAGKYASAMPAYRMGDMFQKAVTMVVGLNTLMWILPFVGACMMFMEKRLLRQHRLLLMALVICSLLSVSVGFYFREHYFITLLPVVCLLIGVAVSRSIALLHGNPGLEMIMGIGVVLLFIAALGATIIGGGTVWFGMSPDQAMRDTYLTTLFSDTRSVAALIEKETLPSARIAIIGSEPEVPFYCHRRSATGHIYMYPLMDERDFADQMQQAMISDIERAQPEFVLYVDEPYSWRTLPGSSLRLLNWWSSWSGTNLTLLKTIEVQEGPERDLLTAKASPGQVQPAGLPSGHLLIYKSVKH